MSWWIGEGSLTPQVLSLASAAELAAPFSLPACVGPALGDQPRLYCLDRRSGVAPDLLAGLEASLSPAEHQRHAGYRLVADRDRFLLGRGLVRDVLGRWLHIAPADVAIELGPHGKPHCPGGPEFNVSHSGDLILLALHPSRPVGVDVEQHRPGIDWPPIARRVFSSAQVEALQQRPSAEHGQAFLQGWCLLEAGLKANGLGFAGHGVASAMEQPPLRRWSLALPAGYCGALALLGTGPDAETAAASGRGGAGLIRHG